MNRKLVHVTWADSASYDAGWKSNGKVADMVPSYIDSVGWVVAETDGHLTLGAHISDQGHVTGEMCIPKGCILKRRRVK